MGFDAPEPMAFGRFHEHEKPAEPEKKEKPKGYRLNLKFPDHYKSYLQEMAWRNRTNVTAYIAALIEADMEKHPNWQDGLDELNV